MSAMCRRLTATGRSAANRGEVFAQAWSAAVEQAIEQLQATPHGFSALSIDPFFANEGFPDLPANFLAPAIAAV